MKAEEFKKTDKNGVTYTCIEVPDELIEEAIKFVDERAFEIEDVPQLLCEFAYSQEQTEMPREKEIRKGRSKILALLKDKVPNTLRAEIDDIIKDSFKQSISKESDEKVSESLLRSPDWVQGDEEF